MRTLTQRLSVLTAFAALVLTLGLSPAKAAGDVVISQVSGGGGSSGTCTSLSLLNSQPGRIH